MIIIYYFFCLFVFVLLLFRATPVTYGSSQARGQNRAAAAGLHCSHSNLISEPCLWRTPELMAMPATKRGQESSPHPHGPSSGSLSLSHNGNSIVYCFVICWTIYQHFFLWPHLWHMKVLRPGIDSSCSCVLGCSCGNTGYFIPLYQARDWTCASAVTQATAFGFLTHCTTVGTLEYDVYFPMLLNVF